MYAIALAVAAGGTSCVGLLALMENWVVSSQLKLGTACLVATILAALAFRAAKRFG